MLKFLVFINYQGTIQVSKEVFPNSWSKESCIKYLKDRPNLICIQPYDTFVICL